MGTPLPKRPETIAALARMKEQRMCRAKTRDGDPCKVWRSTYYKPTSGRWRCRNHGGLCTGPKTAEGRKRIGLAAARDNKRFNRWELHRLSKAQQCRNPDIP